MNCCVVIQLTSSMYLLLLCDDIILINWFNWIVDCKTMMMPCEGDWVSVVISILYLNFDYVLYDVE